MVFNAIEQIVRQDTGSALRWRHLHTNSLADLSGIVHWGADQHRGQAKGKQHVSNSGDVKLMVSHRTGTSSALSRSTDAR